MPTERFSNLHEEKKLLICNVVMDEFKRKPYGELKISAIARRAQVSRGSIYTYFKDREDMFLFALECLHNGDGETRRNIRNLLLEHSERPEF